MTWWEMAAVGAGAWWVVAAFMLGPVVGRMLKHRTPPQRIPLGDYVPDEWVAEWERQNRGRP
jgi:hypothetical protein